MTRTPASRHAWTMVVLGGLFLVAGWMGTAKDPLGAHPIPPGMQACVTDQQCVQVDNDCGGCCQFGAVNKASEQAFAKDLAAFCKGYRGPVCECCGPDFVPRCLQKACTLVEMPGSQKTKCGG